ncbi:MAG: hypothetical protein ACJA1C_000234 [Crocinitomicaceae bacterium]|jgi:hypothetical protein
MFKSIITTVLLTAVAFTHNLNAQVTIDNTDLTSPPATSCTNTFYTVSGVMSNTNYGYSGPSINVVGFNITIEMAYFSGFAPIPGLTPYSENMDLGVLPVGLYTVSTNTTVDGMASNSDVGTFDVVSCCPVMVDFVLSSLTNCYPDTVWTTNLSTGASNYSWYIDGLFMTNDPNPGISSPVAGVHIIKLVADDGNCTDSMELTLEIFIAADVNLGVDTVVCIGDSLILDATAPMVTYEWQDGSTNATFTVDSAGNYWVEVTDTNGCVALDSIEVQLCLVGLDEINDFESIIIYPNPAVSNIQLIGVEGNYTILISSITGELVAAYSNTDIIDISSFEAGTYLIKIAQENKTFTKRLIIPD